MPIAAVISDFGGVLTTPLLNAFAALQDRSGVSPEALGRAMERIAQRDGEHPLFALEKGEIPEGDFLEMIGAELEPELGHRPEMHRFSEIYFDALEPNELMIELMRGLRGRGYRMALLTNNVREWEPLWRAMLPVDEIFEVVVDSAFVGMRKPDPAIYELTVKRLAETRPDGANPSPAECLFVDDNELNCEAARSLGMSAVHFRSNEQAIPEIEAALGA
jgi:putative hydrolase of the HAD superfamily